MGTPDLRQEFDEYLVYLFRHSAFSDEKKEDIAERARRTFELIPIVSGEEKTPEAKMVWRVLHDLRTARRLLDWGLDGGLVEAALLHSYPLVFADKVEGSQIKISRYPNLHVDADPLPRSKEIKILFDEDQLLVKPPTVVPDCVIDRLKNGYKGAEAVFKLTFLSMASVIEWLSDRTVRRESKLALDKRDLAAYAETVLYPFGKFMGRMDILRDLEDVITHVLFPNFKREFVEADFPGKLEEQFFARLREEQKTAKTLPKKLKERFPLPNERDISFDFRIKGPLSEIRKGKEGRFISDRYGVRIIVNQDDERLCQSLLTICLSLWRPLQGKGIEDHIKNPKKNGYKDLKTVLVHEDEHWQTAFEIQIRTIGMHIQNEIGAAAHPQYKMRQEEKLLQSEEVSQMIYQFKLGWWADLAEVFAKRKLVFTSDGDLLSLPINAIYGDLSILKYKKLYSNLLVSRPSSTQTPRRVRFNNPIISGEIVSEEEEEGSPVHDCSVGNFQRNAHVLEQLGTSYTRAWLIHRHLPEDPRTQQLSSIRSTLDQIGRELLRETCGFRQVWH